MSELGTRIDLLLATLAPRERAVVEEKLFAIPTPTWAQIARDHNVVVSFIRRLERHAAKKLRHPMRQREMASWAALEETADETERSRAAALRRFATAEKSIR